MTGIWLIFIIALVSMLIAYLGDILGKRIGKKRISLFGLRPRATAMVITIITGAVIAIITFLLLITFSDRMRTMLLKTEEMQKELTILTGEKRDLQKDIKLLSDHIMTAVVERDTVKTEAEGYRSDVEILSSEIINKQSQLDELTENQTELKKTIDDLELQLTQSGERLASINDELTKTKTELEFIKTEITRLESEKKDKENQISGLEKRITNLNAEISKLDAEINRMQTEDIAFFEGQRLYGFTIDKNLLSKQIVDAVTQSIEDFDNGKMYNNLGCHIEKPSAQDLYYNIVERVTSSSAKQSIVMVFSTKNCFRGDKIPVEFQIHDQYIVFKKGTVIVEERLDKKLNLFEIRDLAARMIHNASGKSLERGLLQDPFGQVSKYSPNALNEVAKDIEKHHRPMLIKLVAKSDIYRGVYLDHTNLEFVISSAN